MRTTPWILTALSLTLGTFGCATTNRMLGTEIVPSAEGEVKTSIGSNDNTNIELNVKHLAPAARISPGATTYVVWVAPGGELPPQNVGALKVDSDQTGHIHTITPMRAFSLSITAEAAPTATAPSGPVVLSTEVKVR